MKNVNESAISKDEIALDDLFAEIDNESLLGAPDTLTEAFAAQDSALDALDEIVGAISDSVPEIDDSLGELDGLFDENELDLDALSLDAVDAENAPEVAVSEPEAKDAPKTEVKKETSTPKKAPKEKSPTTNRATYYNSSKSQVLLDRLGGDTSDIVLEFSDAELSDEELKEKQRSFLSLLNNQPTINSDGQTVQKKVAEKVVILFTMFKHKKTWNEVMYRTFKLLLTDGYIQSGDKGNLHLELLSKPYSVGTARAQAGQMMQMLPLLKIAKEDIKGRLVINEDSTIVARLRAEYFADLKAE